MVVIVNNYSDLLLSVKLPYSLENVNKIKKINGRKWIKSDKIWCIPKDEESVDSLKRLFEKDKILYCGSVMDDSENETIMIPEI